jgi:hypothetical protein
MKQMTEKMKLASEAVIKSEERVKMIEYETTKDSTVMHCSESGTETPLAVGWKTASKLCQFYNKRAFKFSAPTHYHVDSIVLHMKFF